MALEFEDGTTSDDSILPDGAEPTGNSGSDLTCEICGTPLVYAGTGRKPKRCAEHRGSRGLAGSNGSSGSTGPRSGAGRGSASVEQAIATLGNLYDLVGMGFFLASPEAASIWTANVTDLQTRNRAILSGDPELVKAINRLGVRGGKFAFAAVQVSALTPPAMVAAQALRARSEESRARHNANVRREQMRRNSQGQTQQGSATGTEGPDLGRNRGFFE